MVIAFCINEPMIQHLLVCIHSIIATNRNENLEFYVLNKDITEKSKLLVNENLSESAVTVSFINVIPERYADLMVSHHITVETYFRISIADLLPLNVGRVIYLDCDIIVMGSLKPLWEIELNGFKLAAVPELFNYRNLELGFSNDIKYFNSGVLVIDLSVWRSEHISQQVFDYLANHPEKIKFHDQDALNAVLFNKWLELPEIYNLTVPYIERARQLKKILVSETEQPIVMHFNQSFKAWHYRSRHPFKELYYKYLKNTPFTNFKPIDYTLANVIRKLLAKALIGLKLKKH